MELPRIRRLDAHVVAQIAAGEVIESPAAIVKELIENAIDAAADSVEIRVSGDGFSEIEVRDNGHGIHPEDLPLAVESFTTSKIRDLADFASANTMGFRGEALGSIAAVSRLRIESLRRGMPHAMAISVEDESSTMEPVALPEGTRVIVRDLFYNAPVRKEYFNNRIKIRRQLAETLTSFAAVYPEISFRWTLNEEEPVYLPARTTLLERISDLWGETVAQDLVPLFNAADNMQIEGYISRFYFYRNNAGDIRFCANRRLIHYRPLVMLLRNAYGELMPAGKFPFALLLLQLPPQDFDPNVHPQKREVRFRDELKIQEFLREAFARAISSARGITPSLMVRMPPQIPPKPVQQKLQTENSTQQKPGRLFTMPLALQDRELLIPENLVFHSRLFNTFFIASNDEGLFLIDQHTAHERVNYERFIRLLESKKNTSQELLQPIPVPAGLPERQLLRHADHVLRELGFALESSAEGGLLLRAVPVYVEPGEELPALATALELLEKYGSASSVALFTQLAKNLSCRHAVRKGDEVSLADARALVERLRQCREPLRCPHGRPTLVKIDEHEILAFFKRQI